MGGGGGSVFLSYRFYLCFTLFVCLFGGGVVGWLECVVLYCTVLCCSFFFVGFVFLVLFGPTNCRITGHLIYFTSGCFCLEQ